MSESTTATTTIPYYPPGAMGCPFIENLERYTLKDISILEGIARQQEQLDATRNTTDPEYGTGRCTTALASLCFSVIEQLGMIIRKDITSTTVADVIKRGNRENAKSFFVFTAGKGLSTTTADEVDVIYSLFRNKVTHNIFPKHGLGISQDTKNSLNDLVVKIGASFSLNVNCLSSLVKMAITGFKDISCGGLDPTLKATIEGNLQMIKDEEEQQLRNDYNNKSYLKPVFDRWLPSFPF